jgi:hypothetical protein
MAKYSMISLSAMACTLVAGAALTTATTAALVLALTRGPAARLKPRNPALMARTA